MTGNKKRCTHTFGFLFSNSTSVVIQLYYRLVLCFELTGGTRNHVESLGVCEQAVSKSFYWKLSESNAYNSCVVVRMYVYDHNIKRFA